MSFISYDMSNNLAKYGIIWSMDQYVILHHTSWIRVITYVWSEWGLLRVIVDNICWTHVDVYIVWFEQCKASLQAVLVSAGRDKSNTYVRQILKAPLGANSGQRVKFRVWIDRSDIDFQSSPKLRNSSQRLFPSFLSLYITRQEIHRLSVDFVKRQDAFELIGYSRTSAERTGLVFSWSWEDGETGRETERERERERSINRTGM